MSQTEVTYQKKELPAKIGTIGLTLLVIGGVLGIAGFYFDHTRAIYNYTVTYTFLISIALGALFLIALEYVTNADWSVPLRRIVELFAGLLPLLALLVIPLLFNMHDLFHWSHTEAVSQDKVLQGKAPYLNTTFFVIRAFLFIGLWTLFYFILFKNSVKQDTEFNPGLSKFNVKLSAAFIPLFAVTITLTSVDWLMSIEPHWFSTIFGVYYFSGTVVASLAAVTIAVVLLKENNYLDKRITNDHLYSLGALMFAFVNFWAYIAFSQFMLIWYADLPEETFWFLQRWEGNWAFFSIMLIVIQFIVPYAALLSYPAKMNPKRLKFMAVWLLFAHLYDLFWVVYPSMPGMEKGYVFSWIDFTFPVAAVGLVMLVFYYMSKKFNLVPIGDPKIKRGLDFHL